MKVLKDIVCITVSCVALAFLVIYFAVATLYGKLEGRWAKRMER